MIVNHGCISDWGKQRINSDRTFPFFMGNKPEKCRLRSIGLSYKPSALCELVIRVDRTNNNNDEAERIRGLLPDSIETYPELQTAIDSLSSDELLILAPVYLVRATGLHIEYSSDWTIPADVLRYLCPDL